MEMISFISKEMIEYVVWKNNISCLMKELGGSCFIDFKWNDKIVQERISGNEYDRLKRELTYRGIQTNVIGL